MAVLYGLLYVCAFNLKKKSIQKNQLKKGTQVFRNKFSLFRKLVSN